MSLSQNPANDIPVSFSTRDDLAEIATTPMSAVVPPETPTEKKTDIPLALLKPASGWWVALKQILPVYVAIHVALLAISCLAMLYVNKDFSTKIMPLSTLWREWNHWDTGNYVQIAQQGYVQFHLMAFFPLYPLLLRAGSIFTSDTLVVGLVISNIAELAMFMALYRLVELDFGADRAFYTVLYLAIFPSAFFFSMVYTEALFLCFSVLTFYHIRRGHWWLMALFGFLATLTRPDGMFLVIPFAYEYLSRRWPSGVTSLYAFLKGKQILAMVKSIRFDVLICLGILAAIVCVMVYGVFLFDDPLAFVHAHAYWGRAATIPGYNMFEAAWVMYNNGFLSFITLRNALDLGTDILIVILLVLCFIGPWKLTPKLWSYSLYALVIYIYLQIFTKSGLFPLESMSRFLLELFPAFILLSNIQKSRLLSLTYCMLAFSLFFFLASQFATNHWVL